MSRAVVSGRLAYEEQRGRGPTSRVALFLHGIMGSRKNWRSIARRAVEATPGLLVVTADLRGHGDSHGFAPPHTIDACARDVGELCAHLGQEPQVVIGHSFGGKVAMRYAQVVAAELEVLWVLDSTPGRARPGGGPDEVRAVMDKVASVPLPIPGRSELTDQLVALGTSRALARWMTTNIVEVKPKPAAGGAFRWSFDLDVLRALLASYAETDTWAALEAPPSGVDARLIRGGRSDRWSADDEARIARIEAARPGSTHILEDAGHWLHSDDPDGLLALLLPTLSPPS